MQAGEHRAGVRVRSASARTRVAGQRRHHRGRRRPCRRRRRARPPTCPGRSRTRRRSRRPPRCRRRPVGRRRPRRGRDGERSPAAGTSPGACGPARWPGPRTPRPGGGRPAAPARRPAARWRRTWRCGSTERLAGRVPLEHRVHQHGQAAPVAADQLDGDLPDVALHAAAAGRSGSRRRCGRRRAAGPGSAAGRPGRRGPSPVQVEQRGVDLDDRPVGERRQVRAGRVVVELRGVVLQQGGVEAPSAGRLGGRAAHTVAEERGDGGDRLLRGAEVRAVAAWLAASRAGSPAGCRWT